MTAPAVQAYRCCQCCAGGTDPDLHAERGRDFHEVNCTVCDGNADLAVVAERDALQEQLRRILTAPSISPLIAAVEEAAAAYPHLIADPLVAAPATLTSERTPA